jgi:hypothetical protein
MAKNIKKRSDDYAQWYLDVIKAAKLADYAPVRGHLRNNGSAFTGRGRRPALDSERTVVAPVQCREPMQSRR